MQNQQKVQANSLPNEDKPLHVGIIGCGQIAEQHLRFITRTKAARLTALSDPFISNARRLAEQYGVGEIYGSHQEMLNSTHLDVVHVLSPPEFHYRQAVDAIDHGTHVLLEKPCTFHSQELEDLYRRAEDRKLRLCPDFIQLFAPPFLEARSVVDSGKLGKVVHVEIQLSIDVNTPELRESVGLHWRYKLPGGIFHDVITHPLYMALYWLGVPAKVSVYPHSHSVLPQGLTDHLSIMLDGTNSTAGIVISAVMKPEPYYVQVFCERGSVLVNFDTSTCLVTRGGDLPRFVRRATANFAQACRLFSCGTRNIINFARGRLIPFQGLETLIAEFYNCIRDGDQIPISKELAVSVARTEEQIFAQAGKLHLDVGNRPSKQKSIRCAEKILLTGATGYLGSAVVRYLVAEGYYVRALVRELSRTGLLESLGIELVYGDIRNPDIVGQAARGMDILVHMAAGMHGTSEFVLNCAVNGTRNVAAAARECNLKRVIYISSLSVYDYFRLSEGEILSEDSPLEEMPQLRGAYSLAKRRAEDESLSHLQDARPTWAILRPSIIVGHGHNAFSLMGKKIRHFLICPGSARKNLPLIHVDDVARAIVIVLQTDGTEGHIFNVNGANVTQGEYIDQFVRKIGYENLRVLYAPFCLAKIAVVALSFIRLFTDKIPNINERRLASLYRSVEANSEALQVRTGWLPRRNLLQYLVVETQASKTQNDDCGNPVNLLDGEVSLESR